MLPPKVALQQAIYSFWNDNILIGDFGFLIADINLGIVFYEKQF
jgi:hypothetical protein